MAQSDTINEWNQHAEALGDLNMKTIEKATRRATEHGTLLLEQKDWSSMLNTQMEFITESNNTMMNYSREISTILAKPFSAWNKNIADVPSKTSSKK